MRTKLALITAGTMLFASGAVAATYFSDVPAGHWAHDSIQWASDSGLMTGPGEMPGKFDPAGVVNRAQLATVFARYDDMLALTLTDLQVRLEIMEDEMNSSSSSTSSSSSVSQRWFYTMLSGSMETPPISTVAAGSGGFRWTENGLSYDITVRNLSSTITAAHFHVGAPGEAGPAVMPITFSGNRATGTWTGMTQGQIDDLLAGRVYVNVHTSNFPNGEIRGQVNLTANGGASSWSSSSSSTTSSSSSSVSS